MTNNAIMENNLIVDFPPERRASERCRRPSIQFSSEVKIRFIQPLHHEADAKDALFYSSSDYRKFKRANKQAVKEMHRRYITAGENSDAFDGCELTGMENLLTPELVERMMARRAECVKAVFHEQYAQDAAGCYDPEGLARASQRHSMGATERSRKIGMMHEII